MSRNLVLLGLLGLLWGSLPPLARRVAELGVAPVGYAMLITLGGGGLLLVANLIRGRHLPFDRASLRYYAVCGLMGSALPTGNMFFALQTLPAGVVAIIIATAPMMTYLIALAFGEEQFSSRRALGLGVGLAGAAMIPLAALYGGEQATGLGASAVGVALVTFLTPFSYAATTVYAGRNRPPGAQPLLLASGLLLASAVFLSIGSLALGQWPTPAAYVAQANVLIGIHCFVTAGAYVVFFSLLTRAGPVFTGQVGYVVTIVGVAVGMAFLGERHGPAVWVAMALVFAGVTLVNSKQKAVRP